jgi:hypothetical protein
MCEKMQNLCFRTECTISGGPQVVKMVSHQMQLVYSPGFPPTRLTAVPDKWVRPTRRPANLLVGPTNLVGGPCDLLKTFQKIPQMT